MSLIGKTNSEKNWNYLKSIGLTDYAAAGIMGCWEAESSNNPNTVEGFYLKSYPGDKVVLASKQALSDYTQNILFPAYARSNISINKNAYKGADGYYYPGFGLAQWTGPRTYNLVKFAESTGSRWQDHETQLKFFKSEFDARKLQAKLNAAQSVADATTIFFDGFEMYAGASKKMASAVSKRTTFAEKYYKQFASKEIKPTNPAGGGSKVMMKSKTFIDKAIDIAKNFKTLYVMGCFGAPMTAANKQRYTKNNEYNTTADRVKLINAASADTFGFDCVCLIKGILWGWTGDKSKVYGGSGYAINGVPDIGADSMIKVCTNVSTDFRNIIPGEAVWMQGHIGIYIGDGLAVECTPKWKNKVQITAVGNIGKKSGYDTRTWTKHGKLPYIDYSDQSSSNSTSDKKPNNPVSTPKPTSSTYTHVVVKGDTLSAIANKHGTSVAELVRINGIKNANVINVGQVIYLYEVAASCAKLAKLGVIGSPDYWTETALSGKMQWLDTLIIQATKKITKAGTRTSTPEEGIDAMVKAGVINSPDYWKNNYKKISSLNHLLMALGGALK